jgi:putative chitinase
VTDPRKPIHDLLRPHLKQGWNTPGLLESFGKELDRLGVARLPAEIIVKPPVAPTDLSFAQKQIDVALLDLAFPANNPAGLAAWVLPTQTACARWGIDTFREVASFHANINVESAGLTRLTESLNYSTEALIAKFGRHRISVEDARRYGRNAQHPANEEMLANILYGGEFGRKNLGNTQPGDGWKFRGWGPKQLTGRDNHTRCATALGIPVDDFPAYLRTPEGGMMAAGWFWKSHGLDAKAATPGVEDDRKAVNGGAFGLADVERIFDLLIDELIRREKEAA